MNCLKAPLTLRDDCGWWWWLSWLSGLILTQQGNVKNVKEKNKKNAKGEIRRPERTPSISAKPIQSCRFPLQENEAFLITETTQTLVYSLFACHSVIRQLTTVFLCRLFISCMIWYGTHLELVCDVNVFHH